MVAGCYSPRVVDVDIHRLLERGREFHRAGKRAEASDEYLRVLAAAPEHPDALHLLGLLAHDEGRPAEALELIDRASAAEPTRAMYHKHAGLVLRILGRLDASVARLGRAIRLRPEDPEAHNHLGDALQQLGRPEDAFASYKEALRLAPGYAIAALNLGGMLAEQGRCDEALLCYSRARALERTPSFRRAFARALQGARFDETGPGSIAADPEFVELALHALADPWARPADLARALVRLLMTRPAIRSTVGRVNAAWPRRLTLAELGDDDGIAGFVSEPLLASLMERAPIADRGLERVLTSVRRSALDSTLPIDTTGSRRGASIEFLAALAQQCFLNGYVFATTDDESERASRLREAIEARLGDGVPVAAEWIAAFAAYASLESISGADRLLDESLPPAVTALIRQQVIDPARERALRETLPRLTPIDPASSAVRAQYEEHPYPRWSGIARLPPEGGSGVAIAGGRPEILVAGCGTGQESIEVALEYPNASVLAVDLSLASLAYAERKAREMDLGNLTHAQADILRLRDLGRTFDAIQSVGVLHHLADPAAGLHVLATLLRPGGSMLIGLYSERARRDIVAARAYIAESGYRPTTEDIRRCRQDLMTRSADSALGRVAWLRDFHATSECRDLLFHVEEHRYTLPEVQALLDGAGLRIGAVVAPAAVRREYAERFPDDLALTDLAHWDAFEIDHPDTFAGMYLLWVGREPAPT